MFDDEHETDDEAIDEKHYPLKQYRWMEWMEPTC